MFSRSGSGLGWKEADRRDGVEEGYTYIYRGRGGTETHRFGLGCVRKKTRRGGSGRWGSGLLEEEGQEGGSLACRGGRRKKEEGKEKGGKEKKEQGEGRERVGTGQGKNRV